MASSAPPEAAAAGPPAAGAPPRKASVTIPNDAKQALSTAFVAAWRAAAKGGSAYGRDYQALADQASALGAKEVTPAMALAWCTKVVPVGEGGKLSKKRMQTIHDAWQAAPEPREQTPGEGILARLAGVGNLEHAIAPWLVERHWGCLQSGGQVAAGAAVGGSTRSL
jgi:hypothetical protein